MTYYLGLWFIVTGGFLAVRSAVALTGQVTHGQFDSPALFIFEGMFAVSMFVLGFFLRHFNPFASSRVEEDVDVISRTAPIPGSAAAPPRKPRPARNPGRG
ncbi:MAG TPA: hypothetical protein VMZ71_06365 [Gemmataceae bacterium]|nr:hypothetical protein [Gemmataceae bacterium]